MPRARLCVGIDIGASSIKLCQLKRQGRGALAVDRFGMVSLPPDTVVDGALMNSGRVVEALTELVSAQNIREKRVALAVGGSSVIIKKISLPLMNREQLELAVASEAAQHIPFDLDDVFLDTHIASGPSEVPGHMDVLLVAAKKDFVNEYTSVILEAGLTPVICDVDAFAIETAFLSNYEGLEKSNVVLVNIGASTTNINILAGQQSVFTRDLALGGNTFTENIQRALGVSFEHAEAIKVGHIKPNQAPQQVLPALAEVERAMDDVTQNLVAEVQRSVEFFGASHPKNRVGQVFLSGGCARLVQLRKALEGRLGLPIEQLNPFRHIAATSLDPQYLKDISAQACVAVGLALRHEGDS